MKEEYVHEPAIDWQDCSDVFEPLTRSKGEFLGTVETLTPQTEDTVAFIDAIASEQMDRASQADTSREHGGILLGEAFKDEGHGYYVIVREAVPGYETAGSAVHLRFQGDSWQPIWRRLDERRDLNVVGWYHTHPGLGIFLSGTDLKTQRLHFSRPWQLAIVLDPVRKQIGYFVGKDGARCAAAVFRQKQPVTELSDSSSS